jgi:lantibiotic biosynthesis protein
MTAPETPGDEAIAGGQALEIAQRLLDPAAVLAALPGDGSLGSGLSGTALLHARLSAADPMFAAAAARHWAAAATHAQHRAGGIYSGPGALAASLIIATPYLPDPGPHHDHTTRAAAWLAKRALDITTRHQQQARAGATGTPWQVYDAINGLSGIGRVLLAALDSGHDHAEPGLTAALTTLTTMIRNPVSTTRPGWWQPPGTRPADSTLHPSGAAATGTAHGIAGVLALLSAARSAGWTTDGQTAAIADAADWLLRWRDQKSGSWPPCVTGDELDQPAQDAATTGRRHAWCYGAPGIGTALALAGRTLADPVLASTGKAAVAALTDRPARTWDVTGPTLCHGYAGVLQAASLTGARATATRAAEAITAAFDPGLPFAVPHHINDQHHENRPGFLTGAAGVALALADHAQLPATPVTTGWEAMLLLS